MKVVFDTSAFIYLYDFRKFEEIYTVQEVLNEVKDKMSMIKLSALNLRVREPLPKYLTLVKKTASKTGDLEKLSLTDLKVLALAKELNLTLISDDRSVQNVAEKLGLKYFSVFNPKISRFIIWEKFCPSCKKKFKEGSVCPTCGEKLKRIPKRLKKINSSP